MSILDSFKKRPTLDAAIKQIAQARKSEGGLAEQLYKGAYHGFAKVIQDHPLVSDSLYHWGFALLHEAATQNPEQKAATLLEATEKFTFCLLSAPSYLGAAIDGGVAFMELARISAEDSKKPLYEKAQHFFETADSIQKGSAAYNLACIHALNGQEEACLAALQLAKDSGTLPDAPNILQDADMVAVLELPWFTEFMEVASVKQEPRTRIKNTNIDYEPGFTIKKTEDFDYDS